MPIANVTLNNTFDEWRSVTNQLISFVNDVDGGNLTKFYSNSALLTVTENVARGGKNFITLNTSSNYLDSSTLNLATSNAVYSVVLNLANTDARVIVVSDGANTINAVANAGIIQANTARTHANASFLLANTARDHANASFEQANTARIHANAAHASANAGLGQANTARIHANASFEQANTARIHANVSFEQANTARIHANVSFEQANTARIHANTAHASANAGMSIANGAFASANAGQATANAGFGQANTARIHANVSFEQANTARIHANVSFEQANTARIHANVSFEQANTARIHANVSFAQANTARDHANAAFLQANNAVTDYSPASIQANTARTHANAAFLQANTSFDQANTARIHANVSFAQGNTAYNHANIVFVQANTARIHANVSFEQANTSRDHANASFGQANTARIHANNAFEKANIAYDTAVAVSGCTAPIIEANKAGFDHANSAYDQANTARTHANVSFGQANTSRIHANISFEQANTARIHANASFEQANTARIHANLSFDQANTARIHANTAHASANAGLIQANTARDHANAAFLKANNAVTDYGPAFDQANTARIHANASFLQANTARVHANSAFDKANAALSNTSGSSFAGNLQIPTGNITIGDGTTQGVRLHVNSWIGLANVFPQVEVMSGTQFIQLNANTNNGGWNDLMIDRDISIIYSNGTADDKANLIIGPWTDSSFGYKQDGEGRHGFNTSNPRHVLDANGTANISGSLLVGAMNVVPTVTASFAHANAAFLAANTGLGLGSAFGQANTARDHANASFAKANAALANVSGAVFAGNLSIPSGNITLDSGRFYVVAPANLTPFGAYGAGGALTWDFNGTSVSYLDSNTIYFRSGYPDTTERMRIDPTGNIIIRGNDTSVSLGLGTFGSNGVVGTITSDSLFFRTSDIDRMRIASGGSVDIYDFTTVYGGFEILRYGVNADFYFNSSGGSGRRWLMSSGTSGTWSIYDSTSSNTRYNISSSGSSRFFTANGATTHTFDYSNLGGRLTLADENGTSATRLEEHINATRLLQLIDGSDMYIGFGSATIATGNLMFMRPGYNEAARIDATGNLLIGRTNSTVGNRVKVDVVGAVNASAVLVDGTPVRPITMTPDIVNATRYMVFASDTTGNLTTANVSSGITFNPSSNAFFVRGGSASYVEVGGNNTLGSAGTMFGDSNFGIIAYRGRLYISNSTDGNSIVFQTGSSYTERMRLAPDGSLAIGVTFPTARLHVVGNTYITTTLTVGEMNVVPTITAAFEKANTGGSVPIATDALDSTRYIIFTDKTSGSLANANVSSSISYNPSSGTLSATIFNSLSDENEKKNIRVITNAADKVDSLRGVQFNWKKNGLPSAGIIAQDLEKVLPELVSEDKSVNYSGVIGLLVEAIKELNERIRILENK